MSLMMVVPGASQPVDDDGRRAAGLQDAPLESDRRGDALPAAGPIRDDAAAGGLPGCDAVQERTACRVEGEEIAREIARHHEAAASDDDPGDGGCARFM